ncbi:MAG: hypothetical protein FNNCIFGK_00603 [Bacteroidia bacterium]|nr:hypothetical protein [Bacteroidia bacterium]
MADISSVVDIVTFIVPPTASVPVALPVSIAVAAPVTFTVTVNGSTLKSSAVEP